MKVTYKAKNPTKLVYMEKSIKTRSLKMAVVKLTKIECE